MTETLSKWCANHHIINNILQNYYNARTVYMVDFLYLGKLYLPSPWSNTEGFLRTFYLLKQK